MQTLKFYFLVLAILACAILLGVVSLRARRPGRPALLISGSRSNGGSMGAKITEGARVDI
jgi:hypothetical protein